MIKPITKKEVNVTAVDPNALTIPQKMLYIGKGYGEKRGDTYIYAIGLGADKCYIYEFNNGDPLIYNRKDATFRAYHEVGIPEGLTEKSCITSSRLYNGVFFYTAGNVVYRYDFNTQVSREIYRHERATGSVWMNFAKREEMWMSDDPYMGDNWPMLQQMGVVFEMGDGTSEFVVLHLDISGKVDANDEDVYPATQVYKGLGKVTDVVYI